MNELGINKSVRQVGFLLNKHDNCNKEKAVLVTTALSTQIGYIYTYNRLHFVINFQKTLKILLAIKS